ncbi:hypothetical protein V6N11_074365 [Hibiscus sabdariffa]|uniref:RRM domain-containing protein n=1 Tax=Hibiscus sabdariffa TaxID=183260 RepID=A0ABR2R3B2_9ROSI
MFRPETRWNTSGHHILTQGVFRCLLGICLPKYLKKLFQRYGQVLDIFIPKKTDEAGSKKCSKERGGDSLEVSVDVQRIKKMKLTKTNRGCQLKKNKQSNEFMEAK